MASASLLLVFRHFPISKSMLVRARVGLKLFYCPDHHPTPDSPVSSDAQLSSFMKTSRSQEPREVKEVNENAEQ